MKPRYLMFSGIDDYRWTGGWEDLVLFEKDVNQNNLEILKQQIGIDRQKKRWTIYTDVAKTKRNDEPEKWFHIVDLELGEIVWDNYKLAEEFFS